MKKNTLFLTLSLLCLSAGEMTVSSAAAAPLPVGVAPTAQSSDGDSAAPDATASTTDETPTLVLSDDYLLPADITAGTRIALQIVDQSITFYFFNGEKPKNASTEVAADNVYVVEDAGDGQIYLKRETDNLYIAAPTGSTSTSLTMTSDVSGAAKLTPTTPIAGSSGVTTMPSDADMYSGVDKTKIVRFVGKVDNTGSSTYLNCQGTTSAGVWRPGTGGWSIFYVRTFLSGTAAIARQKELLAEALTLWSTDATKVGYYNAAGVEAYATAQSLLTDDAATLDALTAAMTALTDAAATASLIQPEAGRFYRIVSSDVKFATEKAIYSGTDYVYWGGTDAGDLNYYWTFATTDAGALALQSVATGKYLYLATDAANNAQVAMSTEASPITLVGKTSAGEVRLDAGGDTRTIHLGGHGQGAGVSGNVIYWTGAYSSSEASAFYIREVDADEVATQIGAPLHEGLTELCATKADAVAHYLRAHYQEQLTQRMAAEYVDLIGDGYNHYTPSADGGQTVESAQALLTGLLDAPSALKDVTLDGVSEGTAVEALLTKCEEQQAQIAGLSDGWTLNLPQAGSFLRIVSANTNRSYLGADNYSNTTTVAFVATADDNATVFYYDGQTLENVSNGYLLANNSTDNSPMLCYNGVATGSIVHIVAAASGAIGVYNVQFNDGGRLLYADLPDGATDVASNAGRNDNLVGYRFTLEAVTSLPFAIGESGYATLYSPVALALPDGVAAYTVAVVDDALQLTGIDDGTIPAATGVLLQGEPSVVYDFDILPAAPAATRAKPAATDDAEATASAVYLSGTAATALLTSVSGTVYTLQSSGEGVGFYPYEDSTADADAATSLTLPAFTAYLVSPAGMTVAGYPIDATTTALDTLAAPAATAPAALYDLSGRRVQRATHGLYLSQGKKVWVK